MLCKQPLREDGQSCKTLVEPPLGTAKSSSVVLTHCADTPWSLGSSFTTSVIFLSGSILFSAAALISLCLWELSLFFYCQYCGEDHTRTGSVKFKSRLSPWFRSSNLLFFFLSTFISHMGISWNIAPTASCVIDLGCHDYQNTMIQPAYHCHGTTIM